MKPREKPVEEIPLRENPQVRCMYRPTEKVQGVFKEEVPFAQLGQGQVEGLNFIPKAVRNHGRHKRSNKT